MTESGLELAESVLEVAFHFAKRSSEGGCGGEDRPSLLRAFGGILGFYSPFSRNTTILKIIVVFLENGE